MAEGQYSFSISLDDKQLKLDVAQAKRAFDELVKAAREAGAKIDDSFENPFDNLVPPANLPNQTEGVTRSFNGLNMATQQLVRELPAASMGINTFFLAVSNNLPIFADQVRNLRQQGTSVAGVLKGIGTALFSWQTALVLGVTALSMYGKEIGAWISSLFKGKNALDAVKEAAEGLNASIEKNGLGIGKELGKYESLHREFEAINGNLKEQERFVRDNQEAFDDLGVSVNSVVDAESFFSGEGTEAFLTALRLRAEAMAAQKLAVEQYEKAIIAETERDKHEQWSYYAGGETWVDMDGRVHTTTGGKTENPVYKEYDEEAKAARNLADAYFDMHDAKMKAAGDTLEDANIKQNDQQTQAELRAAELRAKQIADVSARLMSDAQRVASQAKVDAMKEGIQKEIAQINLNYDLEEQAITKREEELKKLRGGMLTADEQKSIADMRKANASKRDRNISNAYSSVLDVNEADIFGDMDKAMAEATEHLREELSRRNKAWEDYALEFGTFQERLLATQRRYDRLIAEAETEGERRSLEAERDAILAQYEVETSAWAQELVGMTTQQLNKMVDELQAQVDAKQTAFDALDSSNSKEAKDYQKTINELNAKIKKLKELLGDAQGSAGDDSWAESVQVFQNISKAANDAAEGIAEFDEGLADALRGITQLSGSAINMIGAIQGVTKAFAAGASTLEKASAILAVVGAAIQAVTTLISLFKGSDEVEQTMRQFKVLNAELKQLRELAQIDSVEGTIFGDDAFGNFTNNLGVMRDAAKAYGESMDDVAKAEYRRRKAFLERRIATVSMMPDEPSANSEGGVEKSRKQMLEELFAALDELKASELAELSAYEALQRMEVRLSKRKSSTLGEQLPELFENGEITLEGLKELQQSDVWDKLSQENRDLIDELIADWERYDKATKAITDYLKDIFGELGNEINDAIVDAFANGTDAAVAFGDVAGKMLENLISQIGYTAYIAPILSKAMRDVADLNDNKDLSAEDYLNALMGIVGDAMKAAEGAVEDYNEFLELSDKKAEEQGLNTFNGERTAPSKGIAQASQDSVDELNGRMTAIQGHTYSLVNGQRQLINDSAQMLRHLAGIESNTAELKQMRTDMSAMRKDISDMATRGIITR